MENLEILVRWLYAVCEKHESQRIDWIKGQEASLQDHEEIVETGKSFFSEQDSRWTLSGKQNRC